MEKAPWKTGSVSKLQIALRGALCGWNGLDAVSPEHSAGEWELLSEEDNISQPCSGWDTHGVPRAEQASMALW